jgi:hypothetical protein
MVGLGFADIPISPQWLIGPFSELLSIHPARDCFGPLLDFASLCFAPRARFCRRTWYI